MSGGRRPYQNSNFKTKPCPDEYKSSYVEFIWCLSIKFLIQSGAGAGEHGGAGGRRRGEGGKTTTTTTDIWRNPTR